MPKIYSFTKEIKNELCDLEIKDESRIISLLSAYIRTNGALVFALNKDCLILETENAKVIKYIYNLLKYIFNDIDVHFSYKRTMKLNKSTKFVLEINDSKRICDFLLINFLESKIPYKLTDKENKIKGYLAGLFLAGGSCNDPVSSNYHLEISVKDEEYANQIIKLTQKIKTVNFNFKVVQRRSNYIVYLKRSDLISDFLAFIDADESCIEFENIRVDRDFHNVTNRLMNCDTYNYNKTITNSAKQVDYINYLDKILGIDNISNEKMKRLCHLRLKYPEASYIDLAEYLGEELNITISKSSINHLFRAIKELAINLNYENK